MNNGRRTKGGGPSIPHALTGIVKKGEKYRFVHRFKGNLVGVAKKVSLPYIYFMLEGGVSETLINAGLIIAIERVTV